MQEHAPNLVSLLTALRPFSFCFTKNYHIKVYNNYQHHPHFTHDIVHAYLKPSQFA